MSDHAAAGQVADVGLPGDGEHVVLAVGDEVHAGEDDDLVVAGGFGESPAQELVRGRARSRSRLRPTPARRGPGFHAAPRVPGLRRGRQAGCAPPLPLPLVQRGVLGSCSWPSLCSWPPSFSWARSWRLRASSSRCARPCPCLRCASSRCARPCPCLQTRFFALRPARFSPARPFLAFAPARAPLVRPAVPAMARPLSGGRAPRRRGCRGRRSEPPPPSGPRRPGASRSPRP